MVESEKPLSEAWAFRLSEEERRIFFSVSSMLFVYKILRICSAKFEVGGVATVLLRLWQVA